VSAEIKLRATQNEPFRFLLVEDNLADVDLIEYELRRSGFEFTSAVVQTPEDFTRELRTMHPHVVLADYNLPHWRGMEALEILGQEGQDVPFILVTGALGDVTAVDCIKQGATDYVLKGALARLPVAIRRALQEKNLRDQRSCAEENLASSKRDLELYAHVASHDLQEPLRMVVCYTQLLAARYRGKLDEEADKYIGYAVDGSLRMKTLLQDLLAVSWVAQTEINCRNVECNSALTEALQNLRGAVEQSGTVVTHDQLPAIPAERTHLVKLFENLIGNSIKFRGKEAPSIRISAEKRGAEWLFAVADNGIGILPKYKDTIFVIFQRLHAREEYPGNGVGLAICKKIVEHHRGRIWVESELGSGSTFQFTLPCGPPDEKRNYDRS
jgi:signal transduction histidine kinase